MAGALAPCHLCYRVEFNTTFRQWQQIKPCKTDHTVTKSSSSAAALELFSYTVFQADDFINYAAAVCILSLAELINHYVILTSALL